MKTTQKYYKNQEYTIYLKFDSIKEPKVYELVDNEFIFVSNMTKIPNSSLWFFKAIKEDIGDYIYKIDCGKFDKYVRVIIEESLIKELYDMQFGNWEIKDNQMIFYTSSGSEIARYNLIDKQGRPTEIAPSKRVKV